MEATPRPKLFEFRLARRLTKIQLGAAIGVSAVQVGRYELPFGDARRQIPTEGVMQRIHDFSAGTITPADFYPARLSAQTGDPAVLAAGRAS